MARDTGPWIWIGMPEGDLAGQTIDAINQRILSLSFQDREKKVDKARLTLDNRDRALFDAPIFRKGTILTLTWGYADRSAPTRRMVVTGLSGWSRLEVELKSTAILLATGRRSETYPNATYPEVIRELASRNGFTGDGIRVQDPEKLERKNICQARESDAAFMARTARLFGYEFWIGPSGLFWGERELEGRPTRIIRYGDTPSGAGNVIGDPHIDDKLLGLSSTVKTKGEGKKGRKRDAIKNDRTDASRAGLQPVNPLSETRDTNLNERRPQTTTAGEVNNAPVQAGGAKGSAGVAASKFITQGELPENRLAGIDSEPDPDGNPERRAQARFRRGSRRAIKLKCTIIGDPTISAKSVLICEGFAAIYDGRYWVQECEHNISASGYTTALKLISDGTGGHSTRGDARFDLGRLASQGKRGAGGSGNRGSEGAGRDLIKIRLRELDNAIARRIFAPASAAPFLAIQTLVKQARTAYGQNGRGALPLVRTAAERSRRTGAREADQGILTAANALIEALDQVTRSEEASNARLNKQSVADEGSAKETAVTSPEGKPARAWGRRDLP